MAVKFLEPLRTVAGHKVVILEEIDQGGGFKTLLGVRKTPNKWDFMGWDKETGKLDPNVESPDDLAVEAPKSVELYLNVYQRGDGKGFDYVLCGKQPQDTLSSKYAGGAAWYATKKIRLKFYEGEDDAA